VGGEKIAQRRGIAFVRAKTILGNLFLQLSGNELSNHVESFKSPDWNNFLTSWFETGWKGLLPWNDDYPTVRVGKKEGEKGR
jgi:hypothetical protein